MVFPYANGWIEPFANGLTGPGGPRTSASPRKFSYGTTRSTSPHARGRDEQRRNRRPQDQPETMAKGSDSRGGRSSNSTVNDTATGSPEARTMPHGFARTVLNLPA